MANEVYRIVTDRIVQLLEVGTVPWRKPWAGPAQEPKNLQSGKAYRGINVFLLSAVGFGSPYWVTFKQAKGRGGHVRKGEHGSLLRGPGKKVYQGQAGLPGLHKLSGLFL